MVTVFRPSRNLDQAGPNTVYLFGTSNNGVFRSVRPKLSIAWIIIIINGCMYFSEFYS